MKRMAAVCIVICAALAWGGVRQAQGATPEATARLEELSSAFAEIAEKVAPAVVNINSRKVVHRRTPLLSPFFRRFFGDLGMLFEEPDIETESLGSGVIVDPRGYILTNNHVVAGAQEIRVSLADSREFDAVLIGADPETDLAVIKIEGENLPVAKWGDSDALRVGEWVVAIGSPFGLSQTVTAGIVSAKERVDLGISGYENFIQTDAAINPGNSGGALVNIRGELVGINSAILSETGQFAGIGFAVPSSVARRVMRQLIEHGRVIRGWIGILPRALTRDEAEQLGVSPRHPVIVANMYRNSPAHRAGVKLYDIIVAANGAEITSLGKLRNLIADQAIGSEVVLEVEREGERHTLRVKVVERPTDPRTGRPLRGI